MQESKTREKVLKKIRQALIRKPHVTSVDPDLESNVYVVSEGDPQVLFEKAFTGAGGSFLICESELDFVEHLVTLAQERKWNRFVCFEKKIKDHLDECHFPYSDLAYDFAKPAIGITLCESMVVRTGSVFVSSQQGSGRRLPVFPDAHIVLGYVSQLVPDIKDALQLIRTKYGANFPSMITMITGPSRTADIEKILVKGAHGPKEIFLFLVNDLGKK